MATRVLSGPQCVTSTNRWVVEAGATLELLPEAALVCAGATLETRTEVALDRSARAVLIDMVHRERGAALNAVTIVRVGTRCALHDALRFDAGDDDAGAIGTLAAFGTGTSVDVLDRAADDQAKVRIGCGELRDGGLFARVTGERVWDVREALYALRAVLGREANAPPGVP